MPTPRQIRLSRLLFNRHGVLGLIAGRYVMAGYSVEINHPTRRGAIKLIARKGGNLLAIEVQERGRVSLDLVREFHERASLIKAKPILILYGNGVELSEEAAAYCAENKIKVRRIRSVSKTVGV